MYIKAQTKKLALKVMRIFTCREQYKAPEDNEKRIKTAEAFVAKSEA